MRLDEHRGQPDAVARPDRDRALEVVPAGLLELGVAGEDEAVVAADEGVDAHAAVLAPGGHCAVVEAWLDPNADVDMSAHALHDAQELPIRPALVLGVDRHAVDDGRLATAVRVRRLEDERPVQIAT